MTSKKTETHFGTCGAFTFTYIVGFHTLLSRFQNKLHFQNKTYIFPNCKMRVYLYLIKVKYYRWLTMIHIFQS